MEGRDGARKDDAPWSSVRCKQAMAVWRRPEGAILLMS
jgi:hypothetical protein